MKVIVFSFDAEIVTSLHKYDECRRPKTGHPRVGSVTKNLKKLFARRASERP